MKSSLLFVFIICVFQLRAQDLTIGLIADCQYCNCDYSSRWNNDYRSALPRLQEAVDTLNEIKTDLTFHLGDFIDRDFKSFKLVLPVFNSLQMPHYHLLGNHDFSVDDSLKSQIAPILQLEQSYYAVSKGKWKFIVLDGTDISMYKTANKDTLAQAEKIRQHYLNEGRMQAMPWNGAIGNTQLAWLKNQLESAQKEGLNTIVFCHFPILPTNEANLWNDKEVVEIIESYSTVKAFINGHHHPGNYVYHHHVHYLTLQGMVRTKEANSFAYLTLFNHKIVVKGYGREPSRILQF
tara:strand:- start:45925 stop:46803 length:879 start_codon:yes stop_codon:yes gene_type:complete